VSFNKKFIPKEHCVKKEYKEIGVEKFIKKYDRFDCILPGNQKNDYFLREILTRRRKYIPIWYETKTIIKHNLKKIKQYVLRS
tara:strand:- start:342 stop:590 length:249 start_codon:yes stop_codon:yes gene_type:complete